MITPSLPLGIEFHADGAFLSANCYAPQKYIKKWSWESFWIMQAFWCWLVLPIAGALITIPHLRLVLAQAPSDRMLFAFLMGIAYGIGGTAFNISIRYIGFSLTYSIAVGLSSILGTIIPPLVRGQVAAIVGRPGSAWVLAGIAAGALGIAICGVAGRLYETVEQIAKARGLPRMTAHASLLAQPFFAKRGWRVEKHELHVRNGVSIPRAEMSKDLRSSSHSDGSSGS